MRKHPLYIAIVAIFICLPGLSWAGMQMTLDEAFPGFSSNDVGDVQVMYVPGGDTIIWVGTGRGISKTTDRGKSWYFYDERSGLNKNEISALAVSGTTLWTASAYNREVQGIWYPYGRGFNRTRDFGDNWDSFIPEQVSKYAGMVCYDMAIDDTTVWATAWYGGLIRSQDDGQTWENVFVDSAAQADFESETFYDYRNYFFAVAPPDTQCPLQKRLKNSITDIVYDGTLLWVATQDGLHGSLDLGASWFPKDTSSGLNSNGVYCLAADTSSFWVGLYQEEETFPLPLLPSLTGKGFNLSTNLGTTWESAQPALGQATSPGKFPLGMAVVDTVVWAACAQGGLIRSFDGGKTWENVFADLGAEHRFGLGELEARDVFLSLAADTFALDTLFLWAGTLDGLYKFVFTTGDMPDMVTRYLYHSGDPYPPEVVEPTAFLSLGIEHYDGNTVVWTGGFWYEGDTGPWPPDVPFHPIAYKTTDRGETWATYLDDVQVRDFAFFDSAAWVASSEGLKRSTDGGEDWDTFEIVDSTSGGLMIPSQFTSVCVVKDTAGPVIFVGSIDGLAKSTDDGVTWEVTRFADSFKKAIWTGTAAGIFKFTYNYRNVHDAAVNYGYYLNGITGDWVVALAIQHYQGRKIVWAATQVTTYGDDGASFSMDDGDTWQTTLVGDRVWNFAFADSVVWAATSTGLKRTSDWGQTWEVFNHMQDDRDKISSMEFTSVSVIDGEVWAGNVDGLVRTANDGNSWDVYRTASPITGSQTAYAYPSPFSPILQGGGETRIHHRPRESGPVTVKIYDFAMDLVIALVDHEFRQGEVEYDEVWDGRNGKGDLVANGVYFFKVEAAGGQTEWGKVVVLK
jgi:hypothetical protein